MIFLFFLDFHIHGMYLPKPFAMRRCDRRSIFKQSKWFGFVVFCSISTLVGYLMPNLAYTSNF